MGGHDKLMGYQNSTFPIAVYGCLSVWIHAVVNLVGQRLGFNNGDPKLIGRFYLEKIYENKTTASRLRVNKGMETGVVATMHACLGHGDMDPAETVIFGPSTSNQVKNLLN